MRTSSPVTVLLLLVTEQVLNVVQPGKCCSGSLSKRGVCWRGREDPSEVSPALNGLDMQPSLWSGR